MGLDFKRTILVLDILLRMGVITRAERVQSIYGAHELSRLWL
jgi:hypothetical protein